MWPREEVSLKSNFWRYGRVVLGGMDGLFHGMICLALDHVHTLGNGCTRKEDLPARRLLQILSSWLARFSFECQLWGDDNEKLWVSSVQESYPFPCLSLYPVTNDEKIALNKGELPPCTAPLSIVWACTPSGNNTCEQAGALPAGLLDCDIGWEGSGPILPFSR